MDSQLKKPNTNNGNHVSPRGGVQHINFGEDDQMEIQGFVFSRLKNNICWFFYILTIGILRLIFHWYPVWHLKSTHNPSDLRRAEKVLITDNYTGKLKTHFVKSVNTISSNNLNGKKDVANLLKFRLAHGETMEEPQIRVIKCKKLIYIWDEIRGNFVKLAGLENGISKKDLHDFIKGQSNDEQIRKRMVYGTNQIITPQQSILTLLALEALTPFYMFQLFSLIVWIAEFYYYYAIAIVIMSVAGITTSIIQTRKNQKNLKGTVSSTSTVTVKRGHDTYEEISTLDLVPGDLIVIPKLGCEMYCDAVLLSGSAIVNESMLTGESVPVTKTALENNTYVYSVKEDVNHTLFCGTKIIQTRSQGKDQVMAVVIRTAFLTSKGELVRSILYPPPADFKFERDSYKYIGILAFIAAIGFIYTIVSKAQRNVSPADIALKALDIITIVIPPALPAAMTVGKLFAIQRLKNNRIFCINSRVINVTGSVDCVCFDKTGTLTEDALDMWGVVPVSNKQLGKPIKDISLLESTTDVFRGMASCHSLSAIEGEICGDPLDVKMFESTGWIFEDNGYLEANPDPYTASLVVRSPGLDANNAVQEIGIIKQFQFASALQRMSVITKSPENDHFEIFCKGSPEKVVSLSREESIPHDLYDQLKVYTQKGYRVIGLAKRSLPVDVDYEKVLEITREEIEKDLEFVGLLILENCLKPETNGIIQVLKDANLKIVMITGDNIQTAVTVAKECKIIDPDCTILEILTTRPSKQESAAITYKVIGTPTKAIATGNNDGTFKDIESIGEKDKKYCFVVTGEAWGNIVKYFPDLIPTVVTQGAVFARMSGAQKQQLIEQLKLLGYYVAMCGDGANDCGALKAAHVGISLSEAESSVASPFTSMEPNISCVPKVIKEGRAALVTSFGVFKMMLCYSLTEFTSVIILYGIDTNLSSMQFLFIDVPLVLHFAVSFGRTRAYEKLATTPPRTSLLSFVPLVSLALFMILTGVFQTFSYYYIQTFDWFTPFIYESTPGSITRFSESYENYAVFCVSMYQYIIMAIVFSQGSPYRKPIYTNRILMFSLTLMTAICTYMAIYPGNFTQSFMELMVPPQFDGRIMILCIAAVNYVACHFTESVIVETVLGKFICPKFKRFSKSQKKYAEVIKSLKAEDFWMKISGEARFSKNGIDNSAFVQSETNLNTRL
ncbi:probable cation-transporting ATPase 13A3 isoform X2 [Sitophilus oryzae]|uniref:Cation-transporting ATPase n=1 Tax=Sitophilus oryzae TaxID=7048 RepID=A0A6J2YA62_SITOR|nr:probable cation-transporting ATPase 13A3 isoform X2 [Sitophilus oryzae]